MLTNFEPWRVDEKIKKFTDDYDFEIALRNNKL